MTGLLRAIVLLQLAGCSLGFGSSYIGQWSPKKHVDFEVCLQDQSGRCIDRKQVITDIPGRRFWGIIAMVPGSMGASRATYEGKSATLLRVEPSFEYLRGRGRWAIGVRASYIQEANTGQGDLPEDQRDPYLSSFPVTVVGRVSLLPRLSAHAGLGYSVLNLRGDERSAVGARGLVGVQLALAKVQSETFWVLTFEADRMLVRLGDSYHSTGFTGNLGLFF